MATSTRLKRQIQCAGPCRACVSWRCNSARTTYKLMGGMRAAAVLRDIFGGDPPDEDDGEFGIYASLTEDDVPHEWRSLIDAAVDKSILGPDAAQKWKAAAAFDYRWRLIRAGLAPHPDHDSLGSVSPLSNDEEL